MGRLEQIAARVSECFPESVVSASTTPLGEDVLVIDAPALVDVLRALRDMPDHPFDFLSDISAVDWYPQEPRFHVHYHLYCRTDDTRLRVKVLLAAVDPSLDSSVAVWPTADWLEREVWDLMGIRFVGHPNLQRILLPDDWEGHPLRKDYSVGGVPVEYKIEPAYVGREEVAPLGRSSMGGIPSRLRRDRGEKSPWTWTGPPSIGIRRRHEREEKPT